MYNRKKKKYLNCVLSISSALLLMMINLDI